VERLVIPALLSFSGVLIAVIAFANRRNPEMQRSMTPVMILALGQVALGFAVFVLLSR
jgi:heme A synthase